MSGAGSKGAVNPWLVAVAVTIVTFMEVLDTSIANAALRYIAGGLSAAENDSEWVITSYLAANASVLLLSGWLSAYLGRRNYYLISLAVFTISSAACGLATSLGQLILFRVLQGLGGGAVRGLAVRGGSAGTTFGKTFVTRRTPLHTTRLAERLNPLNSSFNDWQQSLERFFYGLTGDPSASRRMALQTIESVRQQQSAAMAFLDACWLFAALALALIPLALLMKESVAEEGVHLGE